MLTPNQALVSPDLKVRDAKLRKNYLLNRASLSQIAVWTTASCALAFGGDL